MKKIIYSIMATALVASTFTICSCSSSNHHNNLYGSYFNTYVNSTSIDSIGLKVSQFVYNDHDYLLFMSPQNGGSSVVHDPDCEACLEMYD